MAEAFWFQTETDTDIRDFTFTVVFATKNDHTVLGYTDTHQKFKKKIKSRFIGWIWHFNCFNDWLQENLNIINSYK